MFKDNVFFTHAPIVGHGGGATHGLFYDNDLPFVEWVNGADMTVEAVFAGHTHEDHVFFDVNVGNMDETPYYYDNPLLLQSLVYSETTTFYIETNTATKHYG